MTAGARKPHLLTLILLTSVAVMSLNIFLPSLGGIAADFGVSFTMAALSISGFLLISAVLQMLMGPLSDRYGRRPVVLWGVAVFTLASLGCALAGDIWTFLLFRLGQGGIVSGMVLSRAVVRDVYDPQDAAKRIAQIGAAMALAPLLGPALGGILDSLFGWRSVFGLLALSGLGVFILCWFDLSETNTNRQASFAAQFRAYPLVLRSGLFWAYSGILVFSLGGFYAYLAGAPLVGEDILGLSTPMVGMLMGATAVGFMAGNLINTRLAVRTGVLRMIIYGRWVSMLGCLGAAVVLAIGLVNPFVIFVGAVFLGFGNGLTLPGANVGVMNVAPHLAGSASGLSGALGVVVGAILTPLVSSIVDGQNGAAILMLSMATCGALALICALLIPRLERP
ncbi:multidrug effflux MFS transporter [Thalassovita mediterranea]|jgi:DHA1 family bicyclomycin/chloramphenicol resistance-like MFS transporter|uniref:Bcr/CflA family efflux transporter n=1 Tax=Thalassovita mediterranea TaxID=340021 RepID=A0A0N7M227_9RHOB|nr:multidrug effflux MFS transporter [Thalassovita mediterranea]CUH84939.1 Sulfonamide resistance protein [Thalassovita mediterranea]SIS28979.1 MFS transporter, DHA1 family, bicyclomycin/chloramphenicol resistance protein [Thalassovita mediterranea]